MKVSSQFHIPALHPQGNFPVAHGIVDWVGSRTNLDAVEKKKQKKNLFIPVGNQTAIPRSSSPKPIAVLIELYRLFPSIDGRYY
jgi:hypothetical protein